MPQTAHYTHSDLENILQQMSEYVADLDFYEREHYLTDLAGCALFHDAIGKFEKTSLNSDCKIVVTVSEEY